MESVRKNILLRKRRWRVRTRISGTADRPRLCVHFSGKHIYAQCVDDGRAATIVSLSSLSKEFSGDAATARPKPNVAGAKIIGDIFAAKALAAGVRKIAFDRGSRRYHGCVEAFANGVREGGLEF
ncbi:MAG: 50S ribosomal protein L18 [Puniceicoccales bacterium]|jgi:large subunit ribosomal protein L18|nr:50S ribosomal protein L18 [Puniceicoccales bacterium]